MSRRDMFKGAAGLSLAVLGGQISGVPVQASQNSNEHTGGAKAISKIKPVGSGYQLLVVLHGMMALEFNKNGPARQKLTIMVPDVCAHSYGAGNWTVESSLERAPSAKPYLLENVGDSNSYTGPSLGGTNDVVIDGSHLSEAGTPYCVLSFPWPDYVIPLRPVPRDPNGVKGNDFFSDGLTTKTKQNNHLEKVTSLPTVHVLVYNNLDFPTNGKPPTLNSVQGVFGIDGVSHLHVFCEPTFEPKDPMAHLNDALGTMNQLFSPPLDLVLDSTSNVKSPAALTNVSSPMYYGEQFSLSEHRAQCNPMPTRGGTPRNCMRLLVVQ